MYQSNHIILHCIIFHFIFIIYTYYKTKSSAASVCLSVCLRAKNSKPTTRIFMGFQPIDRVIHPENSGIYFVKVLCELVGI